jgi:HSP20 family protein
MSLVKFKHYSGPNSFNNLMGDFLTQIPSLFRDDLATSFGQSIPANIKEIQDGYELEIVAPGFRKEDFKINLEKNLLTISAEKKPEKESEKHIRREYKYQSFERSFILNEKIDIEKIEAKYENGVLTLNLRNKAEVKTPVKQITIQ